MAPRAEISIPVALATATVAYTVYNHGQPGQANIRVGQPGDEHIDSVRRQNAWMAAAIVAGISLIARDPIVFIIGGATVVGLDWITRYNNLVDPTTGSMAQNPFAPPVPHAGPSMTQVRSDEGPAPEGLELIA